MSRFWTKLSRTVVALSMLAAAMAAFVHVEHGHAGDHPDASDCPICIAIHSAAALDLPAASIEISLVTPVVQIRPAAQDEPILATVCVARIPRAPPA